MGEAVLFAITPILLFVFFFIPSCFLFVLFVLFVVYFLLFSLMMLKTLNYPYYCFPCSSLPKFRIIIGIQVGVDVAQMLLDNDLAQ
jgi:hypothetical protein